MFLKFTGPMATLSRGRMRFVKDSIYEVANEDTAQDLLDTGRFKEVADPRLPPVAEAPRRGGVRIQSKPALGAERGDLSVADLQKNGGATGEIKNLGVGDGSESRPKLPSAGFLSKKEAIKFALDNFGATLPTSLSLPGLNKEVERLYSEKYAARDAATDADDDVIDENTKVNPIVVA